MGLAGVSRGDLAVGAVVGADREHLRGAGDQEHRPDLQWRVAVVGHREGLRGLGAERNVSAVTLWNFNEAAGMNRSWKEVDVSVSNTPS